MAIEPQLKRLRRHSNKVDVKAVEENSSGIGSIM
jgi:hypothetical protein